MLELKAEIRKILGSKVKTLRQEGLVPAVVYGVGIESMPIKVRYNDLEKINKEAGKSTIIKLKIGGEEKNILIHEIKKDPVSDKLIHADFLQVRMDKEITAEVPLLFEGKSDAVEIEKGVLNKSITTVEIRALPNSLPHEIKVDLSVLKTFEDSIHVKDLEIADGATILAEEDELVASVSPPRQEQEDEEEGEKEEGEEVAAEGEEAEKEGDAGGEEKKGEKSDK